MVGAYFYPTPHRFALVKHTDAEDGFQNSPNKKSKRKKEAPASKVQNISILKQIPPPLPLRKQPAKQTQVTNQAVDEYTTTA